jgi:hypothetical protein
LDWYEWQLNVTSSPDGVNWPDTITTFEEKSNSGPTLAVSPSGTLYLGWTGTNGHLNWLTYVGPGWSNKTTSNQTSNSTYCLTFK